jgi:hypothetical protein
MILAAVLELLDCAVFRKAFPFFLLILRATLRILVVTRNAAMTAYIGVAAATWKAC